MRLLAADIGGTKTLLALAETGADGWRLQLERRYESTRYDNLESMVGEFLSSADPAGRMAIDRACCAVAGPITAAGDEARVTNLGWRISAARLSERLEHAPVQLINDFQAVGLGIDYLSGSDIMTLQSGRPRPRAPRVVLGAGTGLGVGLQVWNGDHYQVLASEGGHVDFAPNGPLQRELLAWLERRFATHVSIERLVSGPGLTAIYEFLCEYRAEQGPLPVSEILNAPDPAAEISQRAAGQPDSVAGEALDLFISLYGAQAGNLALIALPYGGCYVAGGIAPRIIERLRGGRFLAAFNAKGRMSDLTAAIPVHVVMNPKVGLYGALHGAETAPALELP